MNDMKILGAIVLFNPELLRLKENISAVVSQVDSLLLVDNGSDNINDVIPLLDDKIILIKNKHNKGIAYALNQIFYYAEQNSFSWVLTLDQDSVVLNNVVSIFKNFSVKYQNIGIMCPIVIDRNFSIPNNEFDEDFRELKECITSGSFTNVSAWRRVGGFDNEMFIDWVDWDFCYLLAEYGYKIIQVKKAQLLHELGENSRIVDFWGRKILLLNRSPFRYFYVARNYIYLARKHTNISLRHQFYANIRTLFFVTIFEHNKWRNILAFLKGMYCGLKMPIKTNK